MVEAAGVGDKRGDEVGGFPDGELSAEFGGEAVWPPGFFGRTVLLIDWRLE
jgi:hypothetical protein